MKCIEEIAGDQLDMTSIWIMDEVKGINRVVFYISSKPQSTIEWE